MDLQTRIHFIGMGGIGMSGIAHILIRLGYKVSGSDLQDNLEMKKLRAEGAKVYVGHAAENVDDVDVVVVSSAISPANPEFVRAKERQLVILPRAQMLAELMRKKKSIVVAGSHGKSTTSAMITTLLLSAGFDPTAVIGGRLSQISGNAKFGTDDWFVAESDESDGSFLHLFPFLAVVTNIDREHMDHYKEFEVLRHAFLSFVQKVPFDGGVILCADHEETRRLGNDLDRRVIWYGIEDQRGVYAQNLKAMPEGSQFQVVRRQREESAVLGTLTLKVCGAHNVLNALAAVCVGLELGLSFQGIQKGLEAFRGIDRRLQFKGQLRGITVIDDYAHHPTEIRATLTALSQQFPGQRCKVIFQPHRYSRLKDLWSDFVSALTLADHVWCLPVYAASEPALPGIDSEQFTLALKQKGVAATFIESKSQLLDVLPKVLQPNDVLITMGAGDVTTLGPLVLERL